MESRQSNLIALLIVLVGFVVGWLYGTTPGSEAVPDLPTQVKNALAKDTLAQFKTMTIQYDALTSSQFRSLQIFGEYPVSPGPIGRSNPFAP